MYRLGSVVAVPGPPSLRAKMRSKVLKLLMMSIISTKKWLGVSMGKVMDLNCCHLVAPSMLEASYKLLGMSCRAARYYSISRLFCNCALCPPKNNSIFHNFLLQELCTVRVPHTNFLLAPAAATPC